MTTCGTCHGAVDEDSPIFTHMHLPDGSTLAFAHPGALGLCTTCRDAGVNVWAFHLTSGKMITATVPDDAAVSFLGIPPGTRLAVIMFEEFLRLFGPLVETRYHVTDDDIHPLQ